MNKKKLAVLFLLFLVYAGLAVGLFFLVGIVPVIIMAAVLVAVLICIFASNKLFLRWVSHDKPSSYFQDLGYRDMDAIVVGSTKAWRYTDFAPIKNKAYNCTSYKRSQLMNFAALKTYHSHVKDGGKVYFCFDCKEAVDLGASISPIDYKYIHPHIFLALKKKQDPKTAKYPVMYYPGLVMGFVRSRFLKKTGFYKKHTWKIGENIKVNDNALKILTNKLSEVISFCTERNLKPVIVMFSGGSDVNIINKISDGLKSVNADAEVLSVKNAGEWNNILKSDLN